MENELRKTQIISEKGKGEGEPIFEAGVESLGFLSPDHLKNEDNFIVDPMAHLYVVLDGIGGHAAGEVASQAAAEAIHQRLWRKELSNADQGVVERAVKAAFLDAGEIITRLVNRDSSLTGMGTTATVAKVAAQGRRLVVGQLGDSGLFLLRQNRLRRITPEHSYVGIAKTYGLIAPNQNVEKGFSVKQIKERLNQILQSSASPDIKKNAPIDLWELIKFFKRHFTKAEDQEIPVKKFRNWITRSLDAYDQPQPEIFILNIEPGDTFLLYSDGLTDNLIDESKDIKPILAEGLEPKQTAEKLCQAARAKMTSNAPESKKDDVTAVVFKIKSAA